MTPAAPGGTPPSAGRGIAGLARLLPLLRLLAPHRARLAITFVALLVSAGMVLVIGEGLRRVIDEGFARGRADLLNASLATLAIVTVRRM